MFDSEVLESSVDFSHAATKSYLLSNLFDLFFFHFLNSHDGQIFERNFSDDVKASRGVTDIATESLIIDAVRSDRIDHAALVKALSGTVEKEVEKEGEIEGRTADLSSAATAIVHLKRILSDISRTLPPTTTTTSASTPTASSAAAATQSTDSHPSSNSTQDPRISMQYSFIETVSLVYLLKSCQQGLSLPLPWVHSVALKSCLELILTGNSDD